MEFAQPKKYTVEITEKTYLTQTVLLVKLKIQGSEFFTFRPGQFINVQVSPTSYRSYSVASLSPEGVISLILTVAHSGLGSNYFRNAVIGQFTTIIGPSGRFVLPDNLKENLLFLSTGSGIVPFLPMLNELVECKYKGKVELFAGFRSEEDILAADILASFSKKLNLAYSVCLTEPSALWNGKSGRITKFCKVNDPENTQVFACGNPNMIQDVFSGLKQIGFNLEQFFHEKFLVLGKDQVDCSIESAGQKAD
jgi:CDP-4-dehydro-6-deoxyglucose reductase